MQKHSDRMDKRAPINCHGGPGNGLPVGLGAADYWSKLDMSALYPGYGAAADPAADPRVAAAAADYYNTSAFSQVPPPPPPHTSIASSAEASKTSSVYDSLQFQKQNGQVNIIDILPK